MLGSTCNY